MSLARATSFNGQNCGKILCAFKNCYESMAFPSSHCIWNMDETGITMVQTPNRVIGRRGVKQIERVTSAERRTLVTLAVTIAAIGRYLPPFFIFPRKKFKEYFLNSEPPGCRGVANPSGWINSEHFFQFLQFF